jgi:DNA-binding CsgD family transcriptional regulator/ArsR family metal-binding transcriptional regulator
MLITECKNTSLSRVGILPLVTNKRWGAHFKLETDIRAIFPYINSVTPGARYHERPEHIFFLFNGINCTVYPKDIIAAPFSDKEEADAFFQKFSHFINDLDARRNEIVPDLRKYRPISVLDVFKLLPQTNCGECGYKSCLAFAGAMRQGETTPAQCTGFAPPIYEYAVYPIYNGDGRLTSTVTIEKDPEKQKEMPDRTMEALDLGPSAPKTPDGNTPAVEASKIDTSEIEIGIPPLTNREIEVLRLVAGGSTNNEISEKLYISPHTVKSHVIHIFNKLGVNDRTQAAVIAAQNRLAD